MYGHGYGASWSYQDNDSVWHVFFAANNGAGIFELDLGTVDLSKSGLGLPGATVKHVGSASEISLNNDGMYCKRLTHPYPCTLETPPLQIAQVQMESGKNYSYHVTSLDTRTGEHTIQWKLSSNISDPPYIDLNAGDISSRDDHAYGVFTLDGVLYRYLARFDESAVEFIAKFPLNCNLNAGAFDRAGDFYASCGSRFYRVSRPDLRVGYGSYLSVPESADATLLIEGSAPSISDIVAVHRDIASTGTPQTWLLGIASGGSAGTLVLFCVDTRRTYELVLSGFEYGNGWGAAWNHWDTDGNTQKIFFSANNGKGVFELDMSTLDLTKSHSTEVGGASEALWC